MQFILPDEYENRTQRLTFYRSKRNVIHLLLDGLNLIEFKEGENPTCKINTKNIEGKGIKVEIV